MNFSETTYIRTKPGHLCSAVANEIPSANECKKAGERLGLQYNGSWDGPKGKGFPACQYAWTTYAHIRGPGVFFNTSPKPDRSNPHSEISAICEPNGKIFSNICHLYIARIIISINFIRMTYTNYRIF